MYSLQPVAKRYAWGSYDRLQTIFSQCIDEPDAGPMQRPLAEMWFGAHEVFSSHVLTNCGELSLSSLIRRHPEAMVGIDASRRWGPVLPYLMKVIAARVPLSLQVHPLDFEARSGFLRENAAGIPAEDPRRSFRDMAGKSEMIMALEPFRASVGFAPVEMQQRALRLVDHPLAADMVRALRNELNAGECRSLDVWMPPSVVAWSSRQRCVFRACAMALQAAGRLSGNAGVRRPSHSNWYQLLSDASNRMNGGGAVGRDAGLREAFRHAIDAARAFPDDPAALCLLMMNAVTLQRGECICIPPGTPHAYIYGMGVEIMNSSDNVLRAGLTAKHIDAVNVLRNLRCAPMIPERPAVIPMLDDAVSSTAYLSGIPECLLEYGQIASITKSLDGSKVASTMEISTVAEASNIIATRDRSRRPDNEASYGAWLRGRYAIRPLDTARILVCLQGALRCSTRVNDVTLRQGEAVFVPAEDGRLDINAVLDGRAPQSGTYVLASTAL